LQQKFDLCRRQSEWLANALRVLPSELSNPGALSSVQGKVRDIRLSVDIANSYL
jgi:hypothetical protein